jgi:hypothetical protein
MAAVRGRLHGIHPCRGQRAKENVWYSENGQGEVSKQRDILAHVYEFYRCLMGSVGKDRVLGVVPNLWPSDNRFYGNENVGPERSFTAEDLDEVLLSMKIPLLGKTNRMCLSTKNSGPFLNDLSFSCQTTLPWEGWMSRG